MFPIIRYPNPNGGGMFEMEKLWDAEEIKAIVGKVIDPAKDALRFEEEVTAIISKYNPSTREI